MSSVYEDCCHSCFASQHAAVGEEVASYEEKGSNCVEVDGERLPVKNWRSSRCCNRSPLSWICSVVVTRLIVVIAKSSDPFYGVTMESFNVSHVNNHTISIAVLNEAVNSGSTNVESQSLLCWRGWVRELMGESASLLRTMVSTRRSESENQG